ncbi:kinesin-like protein KIF15, partial [Trifolium medium]|nr:kinesin-like protein KIF15 [Trifolium medium]
MNERLNTIDNCISKDEDVSRFQLADEDFIDADELSTDSSSLSDLSTETESVASGRKSHGFTSNYDFNSSNTAEFMRRPIYNVVAMSSLRRELNATYDGFQRLYNCFSSLLKKLDDGSLSCPKELEKVAPSSWLRMQKDEVGYESDKE